MAMNLTSKRGQGSFLFWQIAIFLLVISVSPSFAQQEAASKRAPWQPDPEQAKAFEERRPGIFVHEAKVPEYELPSLLTTQEGEAIESQEAWLIKRRPEVMRLFEHTVYGRLPGSPDRQEHELLDRDEMALDGKATHETIQITCWNGERTLTFKTELFLPNNGHERAPVFVLVNHRETEEADPTRKTKTGFWPVEEIIARGYGTAIFREDDLSPDRRDALNEALGTLYPRPKDGKGTTWGALAAWSWGASRVMDVLQTHARVDHRKVAIVGHSRGGKCALWTGARDPRFTLVYSNGSGCGGAALSRRRFGERLAQITDRFPFWFCENLQQYAEREDALPLDQHMLLALIAPRNVYIGSAAEDLWADPKGEYTSLVESGAVYRLFDDSPLSPEMPAVDEQRTTKMRGYHIRPGKHDLQANDWQYVMDFADQVWE
ncbi:putative dienelactone hydrolase [Planctomycetales bacterium 10988]|nr:putative dienelactone hydrolase [Planctomycetales bacterium 10988]